MQLQPLVQGQDAFQRIKTVRDLTKPKQGGEYFDLDGNKVEVSPSDKFNLVIDSATGLAARVIYGKVVLEAGEDRALPFGMERSEIEGSFGEKSTGNIFVDSRGSQSNSDHSIAIRSENSKFDETSARNLVVESPNSRFVDAMENRVFRSGNLGIYLSHDNKVVDSAGFAGRYDLERSESAYMELTNGKALREIVTSDPRSLVINIDGLEAYNSPGFQAVSSEHVIIRGSEGVYVELATDTTIENSPLAFVVNMNSNDTDGTTLIKDSRLFSGRNSNYSTVISSPGAVIKNAHYAQLEGSAGIRISDSLHVHAINSGKNGTGSVVKLSNRAELINSPGSKVITGEGAKIIDSPQATTDNGDFPVITRSPGATAKNSYGVEITDSPNASISDAEEAVIRRSPNSSMFICRKTTIEDRPGLVLENRPNEQFVAL